ncbi:hypothetical protein FF1_031047 [Malus domestica]
MEMMEIAKSRMDAGKNCSGSSVNTTSDSRKRTNVSPCFGTSSQAQSSSSAGCHQPINQVGCGTRDIKSKQHVHTNTSNSSDGCTRCNHHSQPSSPSVFQKKLNGCEGLRRCCTALPSSQHRHPDDTLARGSDFESGGSTSSPNRIE